MQHAIIGLRGRINRILDTANDRTVEITDEQAASALALIEARQPAILFDNIPRNTNKAGHMGNTPLDQK